MIIFKPNQPKDSNMKILLMGAALVISGCAVKAIDVQTLVIRPSTSPTTVTVKATGISTDYLLVHTAQVLLEVDSSGGEKATRVGAPK